MQLTVRYFAAARAAAGKDAETIEVPTGATANSLIGRIGAARPELARVLARCSYLCDGMAVRDTAVELRHGQTFDVLPPFAGG